MAKQEVILKEALEEYLENIKPLNVVSEVIVGVVPGEPAQLFNVARDDFSRERAADPRYTQLRRFGAQFENKLRGIVPIYVSSV